MSLSYTVRPISDRTWLRPASARERSRFTATWTDTTSLLERELDHLHARRLVMELDVREQDIRNDGQVRANARPMSDAVVLAFESQHGPLQYRSDIYNTVAWGARGAPVWQHNVRAIALTLESLRAVNRYGATSHGEQYRGFKAIGAGYGLAPTSMTTDLAATVLRDEAGDRATFSTAANYKAARANAHPDRNNGDRSSWDAVEQAADVLRRAGQLT